MAIWPFNRRNPDEVTEVQVPSEIQEYYNAERRERAGVAWMLAIGTLIGTLVIAVGLFFGGRWVYRKIAHRKPASTTNVAKAPETGKQNNESSTSSNTSTNSSSSTNSSTQSSTQGATNTSGPQTSSTSTSTPNNPGASSSSSSSTPSSSSTQSATSTGGQGAGKSNANIPNTGPGDIVAVFAITAIAFALAHNVYQRAKQQ